MPEHEDDPNGTAEAMRGVSYEKVQDNPVVKLVTANCQQIFLDFLKVLLIVYLVSCGVWLFFLSRHVWKLQLIGAIMLIPVAILLVVCVIAIFVAIVCAICDHAKNNWWINVRAADGTEVQTFQPWLMAANITFWVLFAYVCLLPIWMMMLAQKHLVTLRIIGAVLMAPIVVAGLGASGVGIVMGGRAVCKHIRKHWFVETDVVSRNTDIEMAETV